MRWTKPQTLDERIIKKFLFWPTTAQVYIDGKQYFERRWLCHVTLKQIYWNHGGWTDQEFIDK